MRQLLYNLTTDKASALVHLGAGGTETWSLIRVQKQDLTFE